VSWRILENNRRYINQNPKCAPLGERGIYRQMGGNVEEQEPSFANALRFEPCRTAIIRSSRSPRSELIFETDDEAARPLCSLLAEGSAEVWGAIRGINEFESKRQSSQERNIEKSSVLWRLETRLGELTENIQKAAGKDRLTGRSLARDED